MFEELPELETKDFIRKTCESIGWYWTHDTDADEINWLAEKLYPCFPKFSKRKFIEVLIYDIGSLGHQECHLIIVYLQHIQQTENRDTADYFLHFKAAIHKEIPETKNDLTINFLYLYLKFIFSEMMEKN